jgi:hypothetical protein
MVNSHYCTSYEIVIETKRPRHIRSLRFPFEISHNRQKLRMKASGSNIAEWGCYFLTLV